MHEAACVTCCQLGNVRRSLLCYLPPGTLYCLQVRPIVTLPPLAFLDRSALGQGPTLWDNSNVVESYSGVTTPLTFSFAKRAYTQVWVDVLYKGLESPTFNLLHLLSGSFLWSGVSSLLKDAQWSVTSTIKTSVRTWWRISKTAFLLNECANPVLHLNIQFCTGVHPNTQSGPCATRSPGQICTISGQHGGTGSWQCVLQSCQLVQVRDMSACLLTVAVCMSCAHYVCTCVGCLLLLWDMSYMHLCLPLADSLHGFPSLLFERAVSLFCCSSVALTWHIELSLLPWKLFSWGSVLRWWHSLLGKVFWYCHNFDARKLSL